MTKFVVGVDGSEHGTVALRWAHREATLRDASLTAVLAWDLFNQCHADGTKRFDPEYGEEAADAALRVAIERAIGAEAAATVTRRAVCDVPAQGLLDAAEGADLLVVGARGLGGFRGMLLGSVSQQCLHHAAGPVAIVRSPEADGGAAPGEPAPGGAGGREGEEALPGTERILVGVDGSDSSNAALRWALTEGRLRSATVDALHAWEAPVVFGPVVGSFPYDTETLEAAGRDLLDRSVDAALAAIGGPDVAVTRSLAVGGAALNLLDAAVGAHLVVIGRRGLGGFKRLLLGSISEKVARHAPCPVVVMPPDAEPPGAAAGAEAGAGAGARDEEGGPS
jgi:nucleotide-binding universal stress UspA family protein